MVVLFYNHTMYKSNELIFTNEDVIPDKTTLDKGDILIFEHLENSVDDYHSYAITNYLMDENERISNSDTNILLNSFNLNWHFLHHNYNHNYFRYSFFHYLPSFFESY